VYRGRCRAHARADEQARGTSHARGYDADWRRLRARHLARFPWCACKGGTGRRPHDGCGLLATDVDHIESVRDNPARRLDPTNLRSFAHACHSRRTATDQSWGVSA